MKTALDVQNLKAAWVKDPNWDIEKTDGFEEHADDLLEFRQTCEFAWRVVQEQRMLGLSATLGLPGNVALAAHIQLIEYRVRDLEQRISALEGL